MTFVEDVQRAKSPREAMLNLAAGLDILVERMDALEINNNWDSWSEAPITADDIAAIDARRDAEHARRLKEVFTRPLSEQAFTAPVITETDDTTTVEIPPPSPERMAQRRLLESQQLHLADSLGTAEDWNEVYAKGGPAWLYHGNRELVMTLPMSTRQALVEDLAEDSPQQAHEMGRDILKEACDATGFGNSPALADEFQGGVAGIRGTG